MAVDFDVRRASFEREAMPLDATRNAFTWPVTGPNPLSVEGRLFPGLPNRRLPLTEVRALLLHRGCVCRGLPRRDQRAGARPPHPRGRTGAAAVRP
jgi:hypothetical protein